MKKRSLIVIALTIMILTITLSSCTDENISETATIRFSINSDRARTITPDEKDYIIKKYAFTMTSTSSSIPTKQEVYNINDEGVYEVKGLIPGEYSVLVEGKSESNITLSESTSTHFFYRGQNSYNIELTTLKGTGNISFNIVWDPNTCNKTPGLTVKITDEDGENVTVTGLDKTKLNEGKATLTMNSLPSGSYLIVISLDNPDNTNLHYVGYTDVFRISNSSTLSATINITEGVTITHSVNIQNKTAIPMTGEIISEPKSGTSQVSFTIQNIKNIPNGLTEDDIHVDWYSEELKLNFDNKKRITVVPRSGNSRITAVLTTAVPGSMGAVSIMYENT